MGTEWTRDEQMLMQRVEELDKRLARALSDYQDVEDERDAAVARAEQAENARDTAATRAEQLEKKLAKVMSDYQDVEDERDEWKARAEAAEADNADAKIDGDSAVHVVRESDLPAARVDGDYYVVASAKGDYKWPQHGPSWWAGRAQDALAEAARYTSLALLAADREATVDPVAELAGQIETATREAVRGVIDALGKSVDAQAVEDSILATVDEDARWLARHVLGE